MLDQKLKKAFENMKKGHEPKSACNEAGDNSTITTTNGVIKRVGNGEEKGTKPEYPNQ